MRVVVALGGNALLKRGEPPTAENQRRNVQIAARALAPIAEAHQLVITHGNGPQVGLLALQGAAATAGGAYPLDILDAETEGQIGYLVEQELRNLLGPKRRYVTILTQVEVDRMDPAFANPTKPIGPVYAKPEAEKLAQQRGWNFALDGEHYRRVVPSPRPRRILGLDVIKLLVEQEVTTICAGGGGIPTVVDADGRLSGVEAVIDKDFASSLLARQLGAQAFLMLTDVEAVSDHWKAPHARRFRKISPDGLRGYTFAPGSMGPKVEAACDFAGAMDAMVGIGALKDASAVLAGEAGTMVTNAAREIEYWD